MHYVERLTSHNWILKSQVCCVKTLFTIGKTAVTLADRYRLGDLLGFLMKILETYKTFS